MLNPLSFPSSHEALWHLRPPFWGPMALPLTSTGLLKAKGDVSGSPSGDDGYLGQGRGGGGVVCPEAPLCQRCGSASVSAAGFHCCA